LVEISTDSEDMEEYGEEELDIIQDDGEEGEAEEKEESLGYGMSSE